MFNRKSDYALNKNDKTSIIYQDANGIITRLTFEDFSSTKEFRKWKNWMDMKYHAEEKRNHVYSNHTVSLDGYEESIPSDAGMDFTWEQEEINRRQEQAQKAMLQQVKGVLTKTQFRRMWMYYAEGKDTYEIARIEGTCHQAISQSLAAAEKNIFLKLQKSIDKTP